MFGHVRGAFTGADRDRAGLIETSDGGTLFLDEIGEMPLSAQAKLLRFLQEGEFRRVGDTVNRTADVRIVSATNRKLESAVEAGQFREDLYYRIGGIEIALPPLRERPSDIPLLARTSSRANTRRAAADRPNSPPTPNRSSSDTAGPATSANYRTPFAPRTRSRAKPRPSTSSISRSGCEAPSFAPAAASARIRMR